LRTINLAYKLNAPAHLAMSYVGGRGTTKATRADFEALEKELNRLFLEYRPDRPKGPPSRIITGRENIHFDPAICLRGGAGGAFGLGAVRVNVLGREGGKCFFDVYKEIEGATTLYPCQVPADGPDVVISIKNGSELVTSFPLPKGKVVQPAGK